MASSGNYNIPRTKTFKRIYTEISHECIRRDGGAGSPERQSFNMASGECRQPEWRGGREERSERMFGRSDSVSRVTDRLVEMLDHVEKRVELLREHASAVEQERDALLTMLQTIESNKDMRFISEGEREEIEITADRLRSRTLTVEVTVTTPRNEIQKKALEQVNQYIDDLLVKFRVDVDSAKRTCQEYLNACLSESRGNIDQRFQAAIIECTADDQKKTRKRLESLLMTVFHAEERMRP
ncbi:BAG family molecular chaperone regulator 2 [Centruroides vittatus]|uniref:BAG family molecular chaperone regulator 2 n=1 Tax=Centruroides vittatus TaxID=120091 RepID=UPI0035109073